MEKFCDDLSDQAMKIINYAKKEMIPLTNEKKKSLMKSKKFVTYAKNNFVLITIKKMKMNLNYTIKSEIIAIIQEKIEKLLIVFVIYAIKY